MRKSDLPYIIWPLSMVNRTEKDSCLKVLQVDAQLHRVLGMSIGRCLRRFWDLFPATQRLQNIRQMSTSPETLQISVDSATGVAVMKMCRPPVNSLNLEFLTDISISLEKLENEKCKGLILTSGIPKIFCAGLDIMEMYQPNVDRLQMFWRTFQDVWIRLYQLKMTSIAAVNGHSPAGGCVLALSCDYRIMAPNFTIGLNETKLGLAAPFWVNDTMYNVIGHRETEKALQLGLMYTTEEAEKIGLVDKVVPLEDVQVAAETEMKNWLAIPGVARQLTKDLMRKPTVEKLKACREEDITHFKDYFTREAIQKSLGVYIKMLKQRKK